MKIYKLFIIIHNINNRMANTLKSAFMYKIAEPIRDINPYETAFFMLIYNIPVFPISFITFIILLSHMDTITVIQVTINPIKIESIVHIIDNKSLKLHFCVSKLIYFNTLSI